MNSPLMWRKPDDGLAPGMTVHDPVRPLAKSAFRRQRSQRDGDKARRGKRTIRTLPYDRLPASLNVFFVAIASLRQVIIRQEPCDLICVRHRIALGEQAKIRQLAILDVRPVPLREQILVDPVPASFRKRMLRCLFWLRRFLKTPLPRSSAWPITRRDLLLARRSQGRRRGLAAALQRCPSRTRRSATGRTPRRPRYGRRNSGQLRRPHQPSRQRRS
jgi:hypothetical protein